MDLAFKIFLIILVVALVHFLIVVAKHSGEL
jgi:hypothetical protein